MNVLRSPRRQRFWRRFASGLAIFCAACACAPATPSANTTPAAASVVEEVASSPEEGAVEEEALRAVSVGRTLNRVARMRELEVLRGVPGERWSRAAMAEELKTQLLANVPPRVIRAQTDIYELLGVVPAGFDYLDAVVTLLSSELAGFYDPVARRMVIAEDLEGESYRATLSHELVHALQDQHWGLGWLLKHEDDATDRKAGVHALAEGDAMSLMLDDVFAEHGRSALDIPGEELGRMMREQIATARGRMSVPSILLRSVVAPYDDGLRFVHELRATGGWDAVNAAWARPPTSTEQLLHVEKYRAGELPSSVAIPAPPEGDGWTLRYRDVVGEQAVALLLEEWMERDDARLAAGGWGGDRIATFQRGRAFAFAWMLEWDDDAGAERGFLAFSDALGAGRRTSTRESMQARCVERATLGPLAVSRVGRQVSVVAGPVVRNERALVADSSCTAAFAWSGRLFQ